MSALEISSLESTLAFWEWVEYAAAAIVIVGVIGEYISDFTHWYSTEEGRNKRLSKLSTLVLIVGLVLELVALVRANSSAGRLIAGLQTDTALANDRAAQANLKLAEVQRRQEPRRIDHLAVSAALAGKVTGSATILYFATDPSDIEPYGLATQFWASLVNAKWTGEPPQPLSPANREDMDRLNFAAVNRVDAPALRLGDKWPEGVVLIMPALDAPGPVAALKDALRNAGIGISLAADASIARDSVRILIGRKP